LELNFLTYKLFAGASWNFTESLSDYPASDYTLKILLKKSTGPAIILEGTTNGESFVFIKTKAWTSTITNGDYDYQVVAENKTDVNDLKVLHEGTVHIYPLLTSGVDQRSWWVKRLDDLKTTYEDLSQTSAAEVDPGAKRIIYKKMSEVLEQIKIAENEIRNESGNGGSTIHHIRFI
jgi:hypothetical protein